MSPFGAYAQRRSLAIDNKLREEVPHRHMVMPIFNRASYSRLAALIERFSYSQHLSLTVVLSSSTLWDEYGKASDYMKKENPKVEFILMDIGENEKTLKGMCFSAAKILEKFSEICSEKKFDGMIVMGDRYETLPAAMVGAYLNIPLFHIQGGEITGNIDEKVRHAVTKLSDYHFVSTALAKKYLIRMGEERVFMSGCPSLDLIRCTPKANSNEKYFICMFHPETANTKEAFNQTEIVFEAVRRYAYTFNFRCYWFYPNCDPGREEIIRFLDQNISQHAAVFIKAVNKPPRQFLKQLGKARLIVGNSSCALRESSFLGVPAVNIGERQSLRERSWNVLDAKYDVDDIYSALEYQHKIKKYGRSMLYGQGRSNEIIYKQLLLLNEWTTKGPLPYPYLKEFKEDHFGENRYDNHKIRKHRLKGNNLVGQGTIGMDLPGEPAVSGSSDSKAPE